VSEPGEEELLEEVEEANGVAEAVPEAELEVFVVEAMKGLASVLITAWVRSRVNCLWASCWVIVAERLVLSRALPDFQAHIQGEDEEVTLRVSPQPDPVHLTFATIFEPTIPEPSSNVRFAFELYCGWTCPVPVRGEMVTFPLPSAYITKMFAPDICVPIPRPTHW